MLAAALKAFVMVGCEEPVPQPQRPDLMVTWASVSDRNPVVGASFALSMTVRNDGEGAAAATTLRYYRSPDATITTSDTTVGTNAIGSLPRQGSVSESVDLTAPWTPRTYYYGACVDAVTNEADTANNCSASVQVTVRKPNVEPAPQPQHPDLMVTSVSMSRERSSDHDAIVFTLSVTVRNVGEGSSGFSSLRYHRSTDATITSSDYWFSEELIDPLGPGKSSSHSVMLNHHGGKDSQGRLQGRYYGACVDAVTNETDTTNNCSASVEIEDGPVTIAVPDDDLLTYQGTGDHVFFLNLDGGPLDDRLYTLELGELELGADVYLVATNTTAGHVTPTIEFHGTQVRAAGSTDPPGRMFPGFGTEAYRNKHNPPRITAFEHLFSSTASPDAAVRQSSIDSREAVKEGDTRIFHGVYRGEEWIDVAATARRVVTDGRITFALWVEDAEWGCSTCFDQSMIDAMAEAFLRSGPDNDIHDWITAVFGDPWGPHDSPYHIPAEHADQIHMLLSDSGSYYLSTNNLTSTYGDSNERLMFYVSSRWYTNGVRAEITNDIMSLMIGVMAHEYQHVVYYYQKIIKGNLPRTDRWLNEMAAEVARELVHRQFESQM